MQVTARSNRITTSLEKNTIRFWRAAIWAFRGSSALGGFAARSACSFPIFARAGRATEPPITRARMAHKPPTESVRPKGDWKKDSLPWPRMYIMVSPARTVSPPNAHDLGELPVVQGLRQGVEWQPQLLHAGDDDHGEGEDPPHPKDPEDDMNEPQNNHEHCKSPVKEVAEF